MKSEFSELLSQTKGLVLKAIGETLIDRFEDHTEDVFQEVFFRAFKALEKNQFKGDSKISTWLYTIARNEANRMNAKCLKEEAKTKKFLEEKTIEFALQVQPIEEERPIWEQWKNQLQTIPEPFRESFILYLNGKQIKEISELLSLQKNTVKTRIFRAKLFLKRAILGNSIGRKVV